MITRKQRDLLNFIAERQRESGIAPSYDEMAVALGLRSKSGVCRLIGGLEERGFIRRIPSRARAIEIVRMPDAPQIVRTAPSWAPSTADCVSVPVMGRIAAGVPIEAIQNRSHTISVSPDMLASGEYFALEVRGGSMIEAGILDGDLVLIRKQTTADTGDIVVALVDDEEATLKRLRKRGASIALEAANPAYETRIFGPDRVEILGVLTCLIRRYGEGISKTAGAR